MSENSQNLKPGARAVTGYFYAESYEYLNFATSAQLAHYKFFFKDGEIPRHNSIIIKFCRNKILIDTKA